MTANAQSRRVDRGTVLLSGIVGSTAYGLANENSDVDRLGVYAANTSDYLGLHPPPEKAQSSVSHEPDVTYHEAVKYAHLSLRCNPSTTELMWLPIQLYETCTPFGSRLIEMRKTFLSETAVKDAYYGFCNQQLKRMIGRQNRAIDPNDPFEERSKKIAKHARHLMRLARQLTLLWKGLPLEVRIADPQTVFDFGDRVANGNMDVARNVLDQMQTLVDRTKSALPDAPDEGPVETWLQDVRRAHWSAPIEKRRTACFESDSPTSSSRSVD